MQLHQTILLLLILLFSGCSSQNADQSGGGTATNTSGIRSNIPLCSDGVRLIGKKGDGAIKMLLEESNLGSTEVEVAELTLPYREEKIPPHQHGSLEIFYVISGEMEFSVNDGPVEIVKPGSVAVVKKGDFVNHNVASKEPLKALIIWVPGGEANRIIERTKLPVSNLK